MDIKLITQNRFSQVISVFTKVSCALMLTLAPTAYADEYEQDMIVVSEGRQVSGAASLSDPAGKASLSPEQKQTLLQLIADEKAKRKSDAAQGKPLPKRATREHITSLRQAGQLSVNALHSVNQAPQALSKLETSVNEVTTDAATTHAATTNTVTTNNSIESQSSNSKLLTNHVSQQSIIGYRDFDIYEAYSRLFDDFDEDGFYQTFSVTFDADVYGFTQGEPANVYAELYLSRNGGPWEHYYSTEVFTIYGDATDDDYEVLTTLAQGYKTDYYDVLIDLYEFGYEDIVATLSADESDGLYALPLESSDRDEVYEEEYIEVVETEVIVSGGSLAWSGLLMLLLLAMRRSNLNA
ncbi:choice-of-anchor H family protein [Shewanella sp. 10N.7]|uniref:choice-of-anchor H family protein n=1 Tax=Shewanella sp. 10N.7 TaxID=2885093 RepID=UPI001E5FE385|nr:choice-of-anchor H family protein [Shewanella sp. 10N.7]MCC4834728.1 choice-of-anchor H family protein [Shewanella sp. 10N.7]